MAPRGAVTSALLERTWTGHDVATLARHVCDACVHGLNIDGAAISLLTGTVARETLWATDSAATLLEDLQFSLNEGPCMQAADSGRAVLVTDLHHSTEAARWPLFAASVAERTEIATLLAFPLQLGAINLGVLDLYRNTPGGLSEAELRDALSVADIASSMLLNARTDPGADGGWLDHELGGRTEIHQATGMAVGQLGVSPEDALARLRGHAFVHGLLLTDVARDVVDRRLVLAPDPP